jgi:hypothetical protein
MIPAPKSGGFLHHKSSVSFLGQPGDRDQHPPAVVVSAGLYKCQAPISKGRRAGGEGALSRATADGIGNKKIFRAWNKNRNIMKSGVPDVTGQSGRTEMWYVDLILTFGLFSGPLALRFFA